MTTTVPLRLSIFGPASAYNYGLYSNDQMGNPNWPVTNLAVFAAFYVPFSITLIGGYFANATSSNQWDLGVYDGTGVKLTSTGSFAGNGASTTQTRAYTSSVTIAAGSRIYLGMSCNSSGGGNGLFAEGLSGTNEGQQHWRYLAMLEQTAAFPLPAQVVPTTPASFIIPNMGAYAAGGAPL